MPRPAQCQWNCRRNTVACSSNTVTLSRGELPHADYFSPVKLMCALARSYSQEPRYLRLELIPLSLQSHCCYAAHVSRCVSAALDRKCAARVQMWLRLQTDPGLCLCNSTQVLQSFHNRAPRQAHCSSAGTTNTTYPAWVSAMWRAAHVRYITDRLGNQLQAKL